MSRCPWCTGEQKEVNVKEFDKKKVAEHLIVVQNDAGHTHVHGPFEETKIMKKLINAIIKEANKNGLNFILAEEEGSKS